jgi:hypothetical protein
MIYELEITGEKAKFVIAFLKQLEFVKVKLSPAAPKKKMNMPSGKNSHTDLPYFNSCPEWDAEASAIRHNGSGKRVKGW